MDYGFTNTRPLPSSSVTRMPLPASQMYQRGKLLVKIQVRHQQLFSWYSGIMYCNYTASTGTGKGDRERNGCSENIWKRFDTLLKVFRISIWKSGSFTVSNGALPFSQTWQQQTFFLKPLLSSFSVAGWFKALAHLYEIHPSVLGAFSLSADARQAKRP